MIAALRFIFWLAVGLVLLPPALLLAMVGIVLFLAAVLSQVLLDATGHDDIDVIPEPVARLLDKVLF